MASNPSEPVERQLAAKIQIYPTTTGVSSFWREKYERDAKKYWDIFYKRHQDKGAGEKVLLEVCTSLFSHITFFFACFYLMINNWRKLAFLTDKQVGCGAGNTIFPLLATYPDVFVHACDFSQRAINLVQSHKEYADTRVHAFVCDLISDDLSNHIAPSSVDIITVIFALSAVSPEKMPLVLQNIKKVLKPNGLVLFRDYATGDLAQRAFYFSEEYLRFLFEDYGFVTKELGLCCKQVENRSRELVMDRRWIQAVFCITGVENGNPVLRQSSNDEGTTQNEVRKGVLVKSSTEGEVDMSEGMAIELFGILVSEDEVINLSFGDLNFRIKVLSKEYQHTCKSTGMMLWESARLMASVLAENPSMTAGKQVLELGSGCAGICSMVAAQYADLVVATDGEARVLDLLSQNVEANLRPALLSKLQVRPLAWGNEEQINEIQTSNYKGFDVIIGTDVTYVAEAILPLFSTAEKLISTQSDLGRGSQPSLILCHVLRRVDEPSILSAASQFGFRLIDRWPSGSSTVAQRITSPWFAKIAADKIPSTALSILYFQRVDSELAS
ncbi:hypothetical protein Cgig2_011435 [Carnegiea gigantea]|uniref:Methyltransferase type 12 domain-containing protein n=1 Tax=Carnegiea gigantea TaxID=171969 RepID=A0A9Q1QNY5_9CARY|nr:hypothetical protein Cgig2_011435 [Carnegiea gigantea]